MKWLARLLGYWLFSFGCGGKWELDLKYKNRLIATLNLIEGLKNRVRSSNGAVPLVPPHK